MAIKRGFCVLASILAAVILITGCVAPGRDPLNGNIKVYPGSIDEGQNPPNANPAPVPSPTAQPDVTERHITISESNSVFSIGIPNGCREERQVTAERPINFWFEYIDPDIILTVDGVTIDIPARRTDSKLGYKESVTGFSYILYNPSTRYLSYNLRMIPSKSGDTVPTVTREKWIAP